MVLHLACGRCGMIPLLMGARPKRGLGIRYMGASSGSASSIPSGNIFTGGLTNAPGPNDVVVLALGGNLAGPPASPTGFTTLGTADETSAYRSGLKVCYRVLTGPWGGVSVSGAGWVIQCWRGVDTSALEDVATQFANHSGTIIADPPSITPVTSGSVILCFGSAFQNASFSVTGWSGLTDARTASSSGAGNYWITGGAYYDAWSSGAYDPAAWSVSGATGLQSSVSSTVALRTAT